MASGTNLAALLADAGTNPTQVHAVLVSGHHGAWVPGPEPGCTSTGRAATAAG